MSNSLQPHGPYPARLLHPWDFPGKNTGVGCHCLLRITSLSVQFSLVSQLCLTLCDPMNCSKPGLPVHHQLLEFTQTHIHWVSDAIQPSNPLSSPSPLAFNLSWNRGLFQWVGSSHQVAKILEFQIQHQSFQWILGLISFRMDWLDLLPVQRTLKSLHEHHSSKTLILWRSGFYTVQLPHPYLTTGKTIALTKRTFVSRICLCFLICHLVWS